MSKSAIVIGAGIVGLATARALSIKGFDVTVIERSTYAVGASVRNFGMVWPVGQPSGTLYQRACRSRDIWKEIGDSGAFWYEQAGSLHLAYHQDEWQVLQELYEHYHAERPIQLLTAEQVASKSTIAQTDKCLGALWSSDETIVTPYKAIASLPGYLNEAYGVEFIWDTAATEVSSHKVKAGGNYYEADLIAVCSGADFETLYPEVYSKQPITKCKLQMMRYSASSSDRVGAALCGGLSLIHYKSFTVAATLEKLRDRYESEMNDYVKNGIHVMLSQNDEASITLGDSHEYGLTFDPFDREDINKLILDYLQQFANFKGFSPQASWHGIYAKSTVGATEILLNPEPGVHIINALSGAGMTLSFGLAEEWSAAI